MSVSRNKSTSHLSFLKWLGLPWFQKRTGPAAWKKESLLIPLVTQQVVCWGWDSRHHSPLEQTEGSLEYRKLKSSWGYNSVSEHLSCMKKPLTPLPQTNNNKRWFVSLSFCTTTQQKFCNFAGATPLWKRSKSQTFVGISAGQLRQLLSWQPYSIRIPPSSKISAHSITNIMFCMERKFTPRHLLISRINNWVISFW